MLISLITASTAVEASRKTALNLHVAKLIQFAVFNLFLLYSSAAVVDVAQMGKRKVEKEENGNCTEIVSAAAANLHILARVRLKKVLVSSVERVQLKAKWTAMFILLRQ